MRRNDRNGLRQRGATEAAIAALLAAYAVAGCSTATGGSGPVGIGGATSGEGAGSGESSGAAASGAATIGESGAAQGGAQSGDATDASTVRDAGSSPASSGSTPVRDAGAARDAGTTVDAGMTIPADAGACQRWSADRMDLSEGVWTGDVATCDAGDIGPPGRANALKLLNLYRFLAGMPAVKDDPGWDSEAQQCALIQSANGLNHSPSTSDKCYSAAGADGSQRSDLSSGPGVGSIDGYMQDFGNASTMGHRRWILNNQLGPVGLGSAIASCFMNVGGTGNAGKAFVAWPPPGQVPFAALTTTTADQSGWTIQSDTVNVNAGTVTVKDGAQTLQVTQTSLPAGYGSTYAIRFAPSGWQTQAGHDYAVSVSGTSVAYTVQVLACP